MTNVERLFKLLLAIYVSEKTSNLMERRNTVTIKVSRDAKKAEIKVIVQTLFNVKVDNVRTLIVKGKTKRRGQHIGHRNNWKKAYVTLKRGEDMNLVNAINESK
ncbi:50S ribosomal protein L23 [Sodalis sp. CWE]|uniref:50S ribosomal protein L23 n=1 Tax=Sodalis sp. CWE TaxID=2803816 RepID=UPI001C7D990E|nr:50S ribosomal protein L23 [Sodalis sp. CWE]MBX4180742.1 50S ribosomal protein L23 [Sodalis sp. CWE]